MSYVEIVIQVRDEPTNEIAFHHHFHIYTPTAHLFAASRIQELHAYLKTHRIPALSNETEKPCCVCWQLRKDEALELTRSPRP
jgi:hypothetical protein